ncbi:MAG: putative bifunctional diguanylate cyclase/phosphodiesterase, partial [Spirochaetota bacterium]
SLAPGIPLLALGDSFLFDDGRSPAAGLLSNLNVRSRRGIAAAGDSSLRTEGVTVERMRTALERNEFELWYQPVIDLATGSLSGFESLVRWKDADTGRIVMPDRFIPAIENDDIVIPFGFWIIEEACRQIGVWKEKFSCDPPLRVGINLSARQFTCGVLVERIIDIIRRHSVDPAAIALEITESAFMDDMDTANIMLLKLRAEKIRIYLDDFGTGFSSLSYLLHFPVDTIKIDQSFVKWMHADEQSEEIVRSIIGLAHNLKMKVVAEGVEIREHLDMLVRFGCDYIQGYYYSKPLDPAAAGAYIAEHAGIRR